ncbi:hypothetical protein FRC0206_01114 [Corynebacterium diphtheriae]|nr:hypothetical protein FRC0205_00960 [Corynebacterium diphtheriae]CAB0797425.1 hypothetical protein FRC0206_01114 [Corynebacterium diphtheriae]
MSLVATAVIPAAWAADEHVTCTQNFRASVDIDAAINLNVAKHLQRNRDWDWRQIAGLNVEQMGQLAKKLLKEDGTPLHSEEALKLLGLIGAANRQSTTPPLSVMTERVLLVRNNSLGILYR